MPVHEKGAEFDSIVPTPEGALELRCRMIASSNIVWIGWPRGRHAGNPTMVVEFQGGGRYAYLGVNRQKAVACAYAESSGEYLNKKIKPHFKVVKIR